MILETLQYYDGTISFSIMGYLIRFVIMVISLYYAIELLKFLDERAFSLTMATIYSGLCALVVSTGAIYHMWQTDSVTELMMGAGAIVVSPLLLGFIAVTFPLFVGYTLLVGIYEHITQVTGLALFLAVIGVGVYLYLAMCDWADARDRARASQITNKEETR